MTSFESLSAKGRRRLVHLLSDVLGVTYEAFPAAATKPLVYVEKPTIPPPLNTLSPILSPFSAPKAPKQASTVFGVNSELVPSGGSTAC